MPPSQRPPTGGSPQLAGPDDFSTARRGFLKVGLGFSAALACTALLPSLSGCSAADKAPQAGMAFLQAGDVTMFRALLTGVVSDLAELPAAKREPLMQQALQNIDRSCASMGAGAQAEVRKLFDLLAATPLRWALTGIRNGWDAATPGQVQAFLARWRGSRLATLNAGGVVLVKLTSIAYYILPAAWPGSGYPGPNAAVFNAIHA